MGKTYTFLSHSVTDLQLLDFQAGKYSLEEIFTVLVTFDLTQKPRKLNVQCQWARHYQPQRLSSYPHTLHVVQRGINTEFSHFKFGWWRVYFSLEWRVITYLPKTHLFVWCIFTIMTLMPSTLSHTHHRSSPLFPAPYPQFTPQNSMWLQLSWAPRLSRVVILTGLDQSSPWRWARWIQKAVFFPPLYS